MDFIIRVRQVRKPLKNWQKSFCAKIEGRKTYHTAYGDTPQLALAEATKKWTELGNVDETKLNRGP